MTDDADLPTLETVRRLDSPQARELAALSEVFDDLQTVLRCCEWLVNALVEVAREPRAADTDLLIEAAWTTALLSYARCFADRPRATSSTLTVDDLTTTQPHGDVARWHEILLQLRDHHAHPVTNPREVFAVGVALEADGTAEGIALTSTHRPPVDLLTVRQTGAIAYGLSALVDQRIGEGERALSESIREASRADLDALEVITLVEA